MPQWLLGNVVPELLKQRPERLLRPHHTRFRGTHRHARDPRDVLVRHVLEAPQDREVVGEQPSADVLERFEGLAFIVQEAARGGEDQPAIAS